jgi:hypothetical protein
MEKNDESALVHLELKYCERCGGLWLRLNGSDSVFCEHCAKVIAGLLPRSYRDPQPPSEDFAGFSCGEGTFWVEGGNA